MGFKEKSKSSKVKIFAIGRTISTFLMVFKWWIYRSTCFFCNLDQPNATVRSMLEIPKVLTQNPIFILFLQECLFFFFFFFFKFFLNYIYIYIFFFYHFGHTLSQLKKLCKEKHTGFIVRKNDKNNCMHFLCVCVWISLVSSGKKK